MSAYNTSAPVAQSTWTVTANLGRANRNPPTSKPSPKTSPIRTRIKGLIRPRSKEYFRAKPTPKNRANPPTQANILTPRKRSQSKMGETGEAGWGAGAVSSDCPAAASSAFKTGKRGGNPAGSVSKSGNGEGVTGGTAAWATNNGD